MRRESSLRVTHVIAPVAFGGGEALLTDLLARKVPAVHETVVTVGTAPLLAAALDAVGIDCLALGEREVGAQRAGRATELLRSVGLRPRLGRLLAELQPDVVHAHGFPPSLLVAGARVTGARGVYTHHYERRPPGGAERRALTAVFDRYDACTTPADHLTAAMNRHFPDLRRPFTTLRIGVAETFYRGVRRDHWRDGFPPGAVIGVCVGRLVATKNQALIIRALQAMDERDRAGLGVLLVGDGPDEAELRRMVLDAELEDHVRFAGQVPRPEMPDLLASVDMGVFPSTTEASSVAAAEALASGLPVLALDIPSMRETIGDAGVFSTERDFAADLVTISRRRAELALAVRRRAEATRIARVRADWLAFYSEVLGVRSPGGLSSPV